MTEGRLVSFSHSERSIFIDLLKAASIIAVVLYHFEISTYGYLGVDVFLVVAGFLSGKSIKRSTERNRFRYFTFLFKRIQRLLPLLLLAACVCLVLGFFLMLPDDYENLAETVVATNLFSNNILQCITTKNYWDVVNNYKPLMHTWYVGVLFESYIVIAVIPAIINKARPNKTNDLPIGISYIFLSAVSLILYLVPTFSSAYKFYLAPFRLFELGIGCAAAYFIRPNTNATNHSRYIKQIRSFAVFFLLLALLITFLEIPFSSRDRLLVVAFSSCALLALNETSEFRFANNRLLKYFSYIGKASFSIYIWHQIVIAFFRYSISAKPSLNQFAGIFFIVAILSWLSYLFIENGKFLSPESKIKKQNLLGGLSLFFLVTTGCAGWIFLHAGVVRDVPEMEISYNNATRGMHKKYNDAVYQLQVPFAHSDRTKVLVIGDSFARDWVNILKESGLEGLDISYRYYTQCPDKLDCDKLISQADIIFFAIFKDFKSIPIELKERYDANDVYVVGVKNFGESNGIIYRNRRDDHYRESTVLVDRVYLERNERQKKEFCRQYIDMFEPVLAGKDRVVVFTPDGRFISGDCRHLTRAGAQYYARKFDLMWVKQHKREGKDK